MILAYIHNNCKKTEMHFLIILSNLIFLMHGKIATLSFIIIAIYLMQTIFTSSNVYKISFIFYSHIMCINNEEISCLFHCTSFDLIFSILNLTVLLSLKKIIFKLYNNLIVCLVDVA
jgi:hypothetical protein